MKCMHLCRVSAVCLCNCVDGNDQNKDSGSKSSEYILIRKYNGVTQTLWNCFSTHASFKSGLLSNMCFCKYKMLNVKNLYRTLKPGDPVSAPLPPTCLLLNGKHFLQAVSYALPQLSSKYIFNFSRA